MTEEDIAMSGIKVTPEQLQTLAGQVSRGSSEIEGQLRVLGNTGSPLMGSDWSGQASQRFTTVGDEWQRSAAGLKHALDGISQLMTQAGQSYAQAEQQIAGSFRQPPVTTPTARGLAREELAPRAVVVPAQVALELLRDRVP